MVLSGSEARGEASGPTPFETVLAWLAVLVLVAAIAFVIAATVTT